MRRLKYILQHKYYIKVFALIFIISVIIYTNTIKRESIYHDETTFTGFVYKIKSNDNKNTIYIKNKEKIIVYYKEELTNISLGDEVIIEGTLTIPENNTIPNTFNYKKYLSYHNIFNIVYANKIEKIANNTSLLYHLKNKISNRISNIKYANEYISLFVLGDKSLIDDNITESYHQNGLSHLFSISGMHISLFASIILYFLKRISYDNYLNYTIVVSFLFCYILLIGASPSAIRSFIMYLLVAINKLFNLKIDKFNIMLLVLIIILCINPYYLYDTSFEYSYLISFTINIYHKRIRSHKNKLLKSLHISSIAFLISLPLTIYYYHEINILSIFMNILLIPLISLFIFPISLISLIVPNFSLIIAKTMSIVEMLSVTISSFKLGIITICKPSIIVIIIYYVSIYLFLTNRKYIFIFILIFINKVYPHFNSNYELTFLDVGQGDSLLLKMPYNNSNILIDTGGIQESSYSIVNNKTVPYLKSQGITKLNYLIITHGDFDHMGEAINLVENFKVEKVIFNCGEYNDLEQELIKVLDKKKIKYYSCIKELNIDNSKLYFLQTDIYDNENDNSNVIYTELNGYKFMFMGDASTTTEKEILNKYNLSDIDVLKVGHHGSKTSSSKEFISEINPKYSIISVGKNNLYGHPNKEVLDNLSNSKIYRTDLNGSIMFKIKNKNLHIETCSP